MLYQALMVRRIKAEDTASVADVFAEHDATGLPARIGITERSLFEYRGLYFHLVQADEDFRERLHSPDNAPLIKEVDAQLKPYLLPFAEGLPAMSDSQATRFYHWTAR
nr:polyketide synthesis cyclase [Actinoallomurus sp.]